MAKKKKTTKKKPPRKKRQRSVAKLQIALKYLFVLAFTLGLLLLVLNFWVVSATDEGVVRRPEELPDKRVALLLGTSKRTSQGESNRFFRERVEAAAQLYNQGLVKHIIVSGDNRTIYYNEPRDMYQDLRSLGVPDRAITLDYAGLRTLDSVVRSKLVFGQDDILIITQNFHCYRALFIANHYDMNALAYAVDSNEPLPWGLALREMVARPLAVIDLFLLNKKPRFLGKESNPAR